MKTEPLPSIVLEYREGTSDKVYRACIEQDGTGFVVNFAYGRRGATLNTGTKTNQPVPYAEALDVYGKLVRSKTAKGYKPAGGNETGSGIGTTVTDREQRDTGLRAQLLNPIEEADIGCSRRPSPGASRKRWGSGKGIPLVFIAPKDP